MHNHWLKKKDIKLKSVSVKWASGLSLPLRSQVYIELNCGRKFRCEASTQYSSSDEPILSTHFESYEDERFYKKVPCEPMTLGGHTYTFDYVSLEPWDEAIHTARYDLVEKVALSILLRTGELRYEHYKDMYDYYEGVDSAGYNLPNLLPV